MFYLSNDTATTEIYTLSLYHEYHVVYEPARYSQLADQQFQSSRDSHAGQRYQPTWLHISNHCAYTKHTRSEQPADGHRDSSLAYLPAVCLLAGLEPCHGVGNVIVYLSMVGAAHHAQIDDHIAHTMTKIRDDFVVICLATVYHVLLSPLLKSGTVPHMRLFLLYSHEKRARCEVTCFFRHF